MTQRVLWAWVAAAGFLGGCGSSPTAPPAPVAAYSYDQLTTKLKRGVSSEAEVRAALGEPGGRGEVLMPDSRRADTLFYQNVKVFVVGQEIHPQMDILLVFLRDGKFDGYLWTSDAAVPK